MKAPGPAGSMDDCFAKFDEAFAKLESDLVAADAPCSGAQAPADLSEYEEAFTNIDRQLAAQPAPEPTSTTDAQSPAAPASPPSSRPNLALVSPVPTTDAEPTGPSGLATIESLELWHRSAGTSTPLERMVGTMQNLLWLQRAIRSRTERMADRVRWAQVANVFADARHVCDDFDLQTARVRADFALAALEQDRLDHLDTEIAELIRHIRHDLQSCSIWPIARGRVWAFSMALSERAARAFPSAVTDISEGGRAVGFGLHSAAVFHMLRATTAGRRALAVAARAEATGATADWTTTIRGIEARIDEAYGWTSAVRTRAVDFYTALLHDARLLQDAERKLAAGGTFEEPHALTVVQAAQRFFERLAEHVTEQQDQPLTQTDFGGPR